MAAGCLGLLSACSALRPAAKAQIKDHPVPVTVALVTQQAVPLQIQAIGNVQAYNTVSVRPQVGGEITGVYFRKGQRVTRGQLLFTLDSRPLQAALEQAEGNLARDQALVRQAQATILKDLTQVKQTQANLARDQAQAQYAQLEAKRYTQLALVGAVTQEQAGQYSSAAESDLATLEADRQAIANAQATLGVDRASLQTNQATVRADQGALANARVQLSYATIRSPINGQAGDILVDRGNLVQANNTTALVVINQLHPVEVSFNVPEQQLPTIRRYQAQTPLKVEVLGPGRQGVIATGSLGFINNTIDNTTGTIQLIAIFANPQERLWPGQYVNVVMTLTVEPRAIVVPSQAVQAGPKGQYVFVVQPDYKVRFQTVQVSQTRASQTVIAQGVSPGQMVVTDGQASLTPGAQVKIRAPRNL